MTNSAEHHWQRCGNENPYFGVLSDPKFLNANLNAQSLEEFFQSGEHHVNHVYSVIQEKIRDDFQPKRVLDFGCGVGRLVIPFARRATEVVGIDVSPGMLEQAAKNCQERGLQSVRLLEVQHLHSLARKSFDLVHSYIVFQHIPVRKGERLFQTLVDLIAVGGIGVMHVTFSYATSAMRRAIFFVRTRSKLVNGFFNLARGISFSRSLNEMNRYSMSRIFDILFASGCSNLHVEFEDHGGARGAILYFEKTKLT